MSQHHEAEAAVRTMGGLGVRAVRLLYTDLHGVARGKDIPIGHFGGHVRGGRRLLRRRDGDRPPAHAGRRRRGGLRRLRDQARPRHAARRAVAAGGGVVPRRGLDARRLRALAVVPAGAAAPGRRRVRGAGPDADRRARSSSSSSPSATRRRENGLRRYVDELSRVYTVGAVSDPREIVLKMLLWCDELGLQAFAANHEFMNSQYEINVKHSGGSRRGRPRVHAQGGGEGDRRARGPARDLHGPPVRRPGRLGLPRAPLAERRRRQATPSPTRAAPTG